MGQANKRGTFEERQAAAIIRNAEQKVIDDADFQARAKARWAKMSKTEREKYVTMASLYESMRTGTYF